MEPGNSTMLEPSGEDSILIETRCKEEFFLLSEVQEVQYAGEESVQEAAPRKQQQSEETVTWTELCRICANTNDHLIPIFEGEGMEHDLCSKILKYLPIHVSESDTLPLQLCYHCAATLLAWHELNEGCLNAERRLLEMQDALQNKPQYFNATTLDNLEMTTPVTTTATTIATNIAESLSDQQTDVKDETHSVEEVNKFNRLKSQIQTSVLGRSRETHKTFSHKRRNGRTNSNWMKISKTNNENGKGIPSLTDNVINDNSTQHLFDTDNNSSRIHPSSESTNDEKENRTTEDADSNPVRKSRVINATKGMKMTQDTLDEHMLEHESKVGSKKNTKQPRSGQNVSAGPFLICKFCNKKFRSRESYRTHARTHTGEKSFTCHICGKQFGQAGSLYYHLRHVHGGVKNHSCDICGRSFAMKTAMEDHRRIHTGERPYVCHTCGKTFKTKASLYIHGKTHTNEFPYKCTYCAKGFRWRQQMLGHLTVHTGEKNHTCDICGKGFGVKNDLTRHKRVHSEEKPFTCQQCGVSFGQKRYLRSHERLKHK